MNASHSYLKRSRWCLLAVAAMTLLAVMPQLRFLLTRGNEWKGSYTILQPDELLYSAYLNALIDGRPLRNDPSTGQDDRPSSPLPESLFSIQFIPPVVIAAIARTFGASASTAFIVLCGLVGLLASLSIYWLLGSLTGDRKLAGVGVLVVLCFGALAAGQGLIGLWVNPEVKFLGLPFLRRYVPAAPFPLFFVLCTLLWKALTAPNRRSAIIQALFAGIAFGVLVFSYFYLWTAAAAWLVCIVALWIFTKRSEWSKTIPLFLVLSVPALLALVAYFYLISHLPSASENVVVLTVTRYPDLFRIPELIGAFTLLLLAVSLWRHRVVLTEPRLLFAVSFAILPLLVFNQHIVTGRSIQPFHFEVFIANYVSLLGLVLAWHYLRPEIPSRPAVLVMCLCFLWATTEINLPFQAHYALHQGNDELIPVLRHLRELASSDGTWEGLRNSGNTTTLVFSSQYAISEVLPTWAPQGSLLAPGSFSYQTLSEVERKKRLYIHFYYCGRKGEYLRELLNDRIDPFLAWRAKSTMFGPERVSPVLSSEFRVIQENEIEQEVRSYEAFVETFSFEQARERPLGYVVTLTGSPFDFSHIDLWYERDPGEQVGVYTLYRVRLRR